MNIKNNRPVLGQFLLKRAMALPILLCLIYTVANASGSTDLQSEVDIGFGDAISDRDVVGFIENSEATPDVIYMWLNGLSGSYTSNESLSASAQIEAARTESLEFMKAAIRINKKTVKDFLSKNEKSAIISDSILSEEARSLLSLDKQFKHAIKLAEKLHPMIYGMKLKGSEQVLNKITQNKLVRVKSKKPSAQTQYVLQEGEYEKLVKHNSMRIRPSHFENRSMGHETAALSMQSVFQRLRKIANDKHNSIPDYEWETHTVGGE